MFEIEVDSESNIYLGKTLLKAHKLADRARAKGLTGGYELEIVKAQRCNEYGFQYEATLLQVSGTPYSFGGWEFVGVADFLEGVAITRSLPSGVEINPSSVKIGYCDHCKSARNRKSVVFIKNSDGELKQVGTACVKDFLGWNFSLGLFPSESDFEGVSFGGGTPSYSTIDLLKTTVAVVEAYGGYRKAHQASSTKETVLMYVGGVDRASDIVRQTVGALTLAHLDKALELREFAKNLEGESEYAQNLRSIAGLTFVGVNQVGLLASVVSAYGFAIEKALQAEKAVQLQKVAYAETGTKVEVEVTVTHKGGFESAYGYVTIYTFLNEAGFQFKWFCSANVNLEAGQILKIKGTVKGTDEYQGAFSTVLTRCKVVEKVSV